MSPGPSLAVVLKQTTDNGRAHALAASWFHALGVGLWAFACIFGLALVIAESVFLFQLITWAGAAYLAYIGVQALRAGKIKQDKVIEQSKVISIWQAGVEGAMISILNPKLAIFFIAIFSQFISPQATILEQAVMIATVVIVDGGWYSIVAMILAKGPVLKWLKEKNQWVNRITGIIFILLAINVVIF
jgi:threonine/homoserine/homoserine lactone efflux protein